MNGLEALEKLPQWLDDEHRDSEEEYFKASEEYKAIEKELKAFEIINKKTYLDFISIREADNYDKYIGHFVECVQELLKRGESLHIAVTKDEFDLLKEVLE